MDSTIIKKNNIKSYHFIDYLAKGTYIDVKDNPSRQQQGSWRVAKIIERQDKYLNIRFDAWEPKFDQQIYISSSRIAPLRKYSQGYTGPTKKTIRDFPLRLQTLNQHKIKMQKILKDEQNFSAHQINQYLRAQLLIQIDSFLTFSCELQTEQVKQIINHLKQVINFIIRYCQKCLILAQDNFQDFLNIKDSFLLNEKWAHLGALQEVLFYLLLIFLVKGQFRNKLYTMNHKKLDWSQIFPVAQYQSITQYFKSYFLSKNGLQKIKKIYFFKQSNGRGFSSTVKRICILIANSCNFKLPLPILEAKDYVQIYKLIPILIEFYPKEETQIAILDYSINLGIGNNPFQAKLKGINQFKSYLQKIKTRSIHNIFKMVTQDKLLQILKNCNFLQIMIDGKNFNSQIFKRSLAIIKFIGQKKGIQPKQIQSIFKLAENRHQSQVILIYGVIAELATFATADTLDFIYSQILKIKLNQNTINLIKDFTIKAIQNLMKQNTFFGFIRKKKCSSKYDYYGLNLLWKQIQDEGKLEMKFFVFTMQALKSILINQSFKSIRQNFLIQCLQNIKKKKNFGQSIKLFLNILSCYNTSSYIGENRGDIVTKYDKKYQILQICSSGLKKQDYIKVPYYQSLEYFFQFLQEYNNNLKVGLKIQNIKNLWKIDNSISPLLNFLKKSKVNEQKQIKRKYSKRISAQLIKDLFDHIFLQQNLMNNFDIPLNVYQAVDQLFISLNIINKLIDINDKNTLRLIGNNLIGSQFYQYVILNNSYKSQVFTKAKKRFVQLYLRIKDYNDIQKKLTLWLKFFDILIFNLNKNKDSILPVLHQFLTQIQGKMIRQNVMAAGSVQIIVKLDQSIKTIKLTKNSSIFKLRLLIMSQFNIQNDFIMQVIESQKNINFNQEEDYSVNALQLASKGPSIRIYTKKTKHPHLIVLDTFKQKVSYKSQIFQTLINLMSDTADNRQIWQILELLPKNRILLDKLQFLDQQFDKKKWKEFFGQKNYRKLYYKLRLLSQLIRKKSWIQKFIQTGGFSELIDKYLNLGEIDFKNFQNKKPLAFLLRMIYCSILDQQQNIEICKYFSQIGKRLKVYLNYGFENDNMQTFLNNALKLYGKLVQMDKSLIYLVQDMQLVEKIVNSLLFKINPNKEELIRTFLDIFNDYMSEDYRTKIVEQTIEKLLNYELLIKSKDSYYYFNLVIQCLQYLQQEQLNKLRQTSGVQKKIIIFTNSVFNSTQKQKHQKDFNPLIYGALKLKSILLKYFSYDQHSLNQLAKLLIQQYLFHQNQLPTNKIKSSQNIHQLYNLLEILFDLNPKSITFLAQLLIPKLQTGDWRKLAYMDWLIQTQHQQRKLFCGLKNLRATCYINCLLQQFFMIQPFRQSVLTLESEKYNNDLKSNQIFQLQKLFTFLKSSSKGSYNPRQFCDALKIDVSVQSDVDQFFNSFMQKLQNFLKIQGGTQILDHSFKGTLSNQLICEGKHQIQRQQNFLSLGVNIKNKNSLEQALKAYIQGQILDGQNAYYCEKCQKKVRTLKRVCMKDLPNIFIVVLKRFEFNYDTMKKIKVNDYCSFPQDLDLKKYTNEYLKQKQQDKTYMAEQYYKYRLRGVVVHYGSSQAGHYYSYIKSNKDRFQFNDDLISPFNFNDLAQQTFGGTQTFGNNENESIKTEKCKNAYLLFYERQSYYNLKRQKTKQMIELNLNKNSKLNQLALNDNRNFQFVNIIFQPQFLKFIVHLTSTHNFQTIKLIFIYFHTVVLRSRDKQDYIIPIGTKLENLILNEPGVAQWYLKQINQNFIKQFMIQAPKIIKYIVVGFVKIALNKIDIYDEKLIALLVSCVQRKGMTPYAKIFYDISKKVQGKQLLLKYFYPMRVLAYILSDSSVKCQDITITQQKSQFGVLKQKKQKQKQFDSVALSQSLQNFQIQFQNLQQILNKTNSRNTRKSVAKIAMQYFKSIQETEEKLGIITMKMINGDERDIKNYMYWFRQLLKFKDQMLASRINIIVKKHLQLFQPYQNTYYPFQNLLRYLFKFAFKHPQYRAQLLAQFDQNPKSLKIIQLWIESSGIAARKVYHQQWTAYKKKAAGSLPETSSYYQDKKQFRSRQLQKILCKNNGEQLISDMIDSDEQITNKNMQLKKNEMFVKSGLKNMNRIVVMNRVGLVYQVSVQGTMKWYVGDKDQVQFLSSLS